MAPPQTAGLLSLEEDEDLPESGMEFQQKASSLSFLEACKVSLQYVQPHSRHTPLAGILREGLKDSGDALFEAAAQQQHAAHPALPMQPSICT